ncbi:nucleolar protein 12-domain-containing protein [Fennellomyces sp. T-0311]|nr:nucleolar protein 12-domain-containing protein [Fennellomyces sp. T-0311]
MPKAKVKNTDILTAGSKAYAKKRKRKQQTVERIDFDPAQRKEYLTGFHKRKVERKKKAQEKYQERARQEKIRDRAALKAERRRQMEERLADVNAALKAGLSDDEDDQEVTLPSDTEGKEVAKKDPDVKEFKSASALTTVTVIEDMDDWNNDN